MTSFNPDAGFSGDPTVSRWAGAQAAIADMRRAADGASLMLWPEAGQVGLFVDPLAGSPAIYERLADYPGVALTRSSAAYSDGWNRVNGSRPGPLIAHGNNEPQLSPQGGLLVGNSVENLIANPRAEGAALPADPSGWAKMFPGATATFVGRGVENGWPYIEVEVSGTLTGTGYVRPNTITATSGQWLTASMGVALVSGQITGATQMSISAGTVGATTLALAPYHQRWSVSHQATATGSAWCIVTWATGTVFTAARLRIYAPQLTATRYPGPTALPPVASPGAVVRAADTLTLPTAGWYRHGAGTLLVEFIQPARRPDAPNGAGGDVGLAGLHGTGENRRGLSFVAATGSLQAWTRSDASTVVNVPGATLAVGARGLVALTWSGQVCRAALNGAVGSEFGAAVAATPPTDLRLGRRGLGGDSPNVCSEAPIQSLRFIPRSLTEAELISATNPYWSA